MTRCGGSAPGIEASARPRYIPDMEQTDILIAGGGIAGLSAAARLGSEGLSVTLVDPSPLTQSGAADLRTTAFLQPAIETLEKAGAWAAMQAEGAELRVMRIVDAGGVERAPRETVDFNGSETGSGRFGWNIPNAAAKAALLARLTGMPNVRLVANASVTGYVPRLDHAILRTDTGAMFAAKLAVAADGRDSGLRRLAGIRHRRWEYGQQALVFAVTHPAPHNGVSTEIHRTGGPLTLVPMPDHDGRPCSSVVWMMPGARAAERMALDDTALAAELTAETMGLFGPLTIASKRASWPIISQAALHLCAERLVLIAEAAHVMPPIGAQGLNTSLHDIETLADLLAAAPDPGAEDLLRRFERQILPRTLARIAGIDFLNRAAIAEPQPLRDLRRAGLKAIASIPPLRSFAIRAGMGG